MDTMAMENNFVWMYVCMYVRDKDSFTVFGSSVSNVNIFVSVFLGV